MKGKDKIIYLVISFFLSFFSCATVKELQGGEKDKEPPKFLSSMPILGATKVSEKIKKIELFFDKKIILKDLKKITISPPIEKAFDFLPKKLATKKLTIKPLIPLKSDTSYIINFGESIQDNTEGNKLSFFKYVFSTGEEVDSLVVEGILKDAYEDDIPKNALVGLYRIEEDQKEFDEQRLFKEKPYYLTKASKEGDYKLENIKKGRYQLVAYTSNMKSNLIYDPKNEKLGFLSAIFLLEENQVFSLSLSKELLPFKFNEVKKKGPGVLDFSFDGPFDNIEIKADKNIERSAIVQGKDLIEYWYKFPSSSEYPSRIEFDIHKDGAFYEKVGVNLEKKPMDDKLEFSLKRKDEPIDPTSSIWFFSQRPLYDIKEDKIKIYDEKNQLISFKLIKDELDAKKIGLNFSKLFDASYKVIFEQEAFEDILGAKNTELSFKIKAGKEGDFGSLFVELTKIPEHSFWLELLNKKKEVVYKSYGKQLNHKISYIIPGEYKLRLIIDENEDKKWNPSNFIERKQAEPVYYSHIITVKALWDLNQRWDFSIPSIKKETETEKKEEK